MDYRLQIWTGFVLAEVSPDALITTITIIIHTNSNIVIITITTDITTTTGESLLQQLWHNTPTGRPTQPPIQVTSNGIHNLFNFYTLCMGSNCRANYKPSASGNTPQLLFFKRCILMLCIPVIWLEHNRTACSPQMLFHILTWVTDVLTSVTVEAKLSSDELRNDRCRRPSGETGDMQ